ncbi:MAG: protoporphyrinogen oxidase [Minicystis sp.]
MTPRRVVIVGGGITGLTAAYRLLRRGTDASGAPITVTLLESRPRLGGNIQTERRDGFVIDAGPDAFVAARPHATALCKEVGLGDRLIGTSEKARKVYIRQDGVPHLLPEGVVLGIPTRLGPLVRTRLFSWPGKIRMGLDLVLPRRRGGADESVGSFMRRRLGREAVDRLAEPLLGGIYAGNVDALSVRAAFPQLLDLEQKYGSLIRGTLAQRAHRPAPRDKAPPSVFYSLLGGMGELVETLARSIDKLGGIIRIGAEVEAVTAGNLDARFHVRVRGEGDPILADDVILASPAFAAADALDGLDRDLANRLRQIPYVSTATVTVGFPRADVPHPLDASGLIIPKGERRDVLAATFVSSKWSGRAPADVALMRVFIGGYRDPGALAQSDDELVSLARRELEILVGVRARPVIARVFRYERGNAQPSLGHPERLARLRSLAARHPGLHLAGAAYDGVGIPDCVRQAEEVAARIADTT